MHSFRFWRRLFLVWAIALLPARLMAQAATDEADTGFIGRLTQAEQASAGLPRLAPEERVTLNDLVQREVRMARQGDVIAFAGTFSTRRPPSEFAAAGLATLSPEETAALDLLVARALAQRPAVVFPRTEPAAETVETVTRRAQWRGEFTATYGRGSGGREFYGGSVTTIYDDPDRNFSAALTLAQYRGDGYMFGPGYGYGGYGYGCGPGLSPFGIHGRRR